MTDEYDDLNVVSLDKFRKPAELSTEQKIEEAIREQQQQNRLNESAADLENVDEILLCPQTEIVRDEILKYIRKKMADNGLLPDHPNYWVIHKALEEMLEVGFRVQDMAIAEDLLMFDNFPEDIFDPNSYTYEVPTKGWMDNSDDN